MHNTLVHLLLTAILNAFLVPTGAQGQVVQHHDVNRLGAAAARHENYLEFEEALKVSREGLNLSRRRRADRMQAGFLLRQGRLLYRLGRLGEAEERLFELTDRAGDVDASNQGYLEALCFLSFVYLDTGRASLATQTCDYVLEVLGSEADAEEDLSLQYLRALALWGKGLGVMSDQGLTDSKQTLQEAAVAGRACLEEATPARRLDPPQLIDLAKRTQLLSKSLDLLGEEGDWAEALRREAKILEEKAQARAKSIISRRKEQGLAR